MPNLFSPEATAKAVHESLDAAYAAIPEGKSHAILVDATQGDVRALYVQRVGGGWQIALQGQWTGGDHVAGKVSALKAW